MKKYLTKRNLYIGMFVILYLLVGLVSLFHSFAFFGLANNGPMSIMLGCCFEIGQVAVLMSLLTSKKDRGRVMPWVLMGILTIVQIIGNIFSSYKYMMTNATSDLVYFKDPIFVWTDLPDNITTVIVTYIIGAILPIIALCMTSMVSNYIMDDDPNDNKELINPVELNHNKEDGKNDLPEIKTERNEEPTREVVETNDGKESIYDNNEDIKSEESKLEEEPKHEQEEAKPEEIAKTIETTDNKENDGTIETDDRSNEEVRTNVKGTDENDIEKVKEPTSIKSHFLNI